MNKQDYISVKVFQADFAIPLPEYETDGAVGLDVKSAMECVIPANESALISTGLRLAIPEGYEAQIRSRSGLALKKKVIVLNSPGTIDPDYRGEVKIILMNLGTEPFEVKFGDRIAQMVFAPVAKIKWEEVTEFDTTERNTNGFGSTGV